MRIRAKSYQKFYKLIPSFNNWRLPLFLNTYLDQWLAIDHRKDKSLSAKDFRLWLYLRLNNKLAKFLKFT